MLIFLINIICLYSLCKFAQEVCTMYSHLFNLTISDTTNILTEYYKEHIIMFVLVTYFESLDKINLFLLLLF